MNQTYDNIELIVVTNGPNANDIGADLRQAYASDHRVTILSTAVRDLNFSLDFGLHHAHGALVARMDSDDVMRGDRIRIQVNYFLSHPEVSVLGSAYDLIDEGMSVLKSIRLPSSDAEIRSRMYYANPICHPSVMFRADIVRRMGGYRGGKNAEDYDLWTRLAFDRDVIFHNLHDPLLKYNIDPSGLARRSRLAYANVAAVQLRSFLICWDFRWLLGCFLTIGKLILRSSKH